MAHESDAGPERAPNDPGDGPPTPVGRGEAIGKLAGLLATFAAAGDLEGARALHETIGRLLGAAAPRAEGAAVVDLESERKRRGR